MINIGITILAPTGPILVGAATERDAAIASEKVLFAMMPRALPVLVEVQCCDRAMQVRLINYLVDLQCDLAVSRQPSAPQ